MAAKGNVWAANSQDYDSILFGTPRLVRYVTIQGKEYLPSKGTSRPLKPQLIEAEDFMSGLSLSREQLIDIAILVGTDFNKGITGIGPKTALRLLQKHGTIENLPEEIKSKASDNFREVREIFLNPPVTEQFSTASSPLQERELYDFLCNQKNFTRRKVAIAIERMKRAQAQSNLLQWAERR
jgi:flap endonuclease-1